MKTKILQNTKSIILALILTLCVGYVSASSTFTNPPTGATPATYNTDAPINTGASGQMKDGNLWIKAIGFDKGLIVENGKVGIGTATPAQKLDVVGSIQQSAVKSANLAADANGKIVAATSSSSCQFFSQTVSSNPAKVYCPESYPHLLTGGCDNGGGPLNGSRPITNLAAGEPNGWRCWSDTLPNYVTIVCCS